MDQAPGMSAAFEIVDQLLGRLDDSHTFIIPPRWVRHLDYGFKVRFVGDTAFVTEVSPESENYVFGCRLLNKKYTPTPIRVKMSPAPACNGRSISVLITKKTDVPTKIIGVIG